MSSEAIKAQIAICQAKIEKCKAKIAEYEALLADVTNMGSYLKTSTEQYAELINSVTGIYQLDGGKPNFIKKMDTNNKDIKLASSTVNETVINKINAKIAQLKAELAALQRELANLQAQLAAALAAEAEAEAEASE